MSLMLWIKQKNWIVLNCDTDDLLKSKSIYFADTQELHRICPKSMRILVMPIFGNDNEFQQLKISCPWLISKIKMPSPQGGYFLNIISTW